MNRSNSGFESHESPFIWLSGGTGRHAALKQQFLQESEFESREGYMIYRDETEYALEDWRSQNGREYELVHVDNELYINPAGNVERILDGITISIEYDDFFDSLDNDFLG